MTNATRGSLWLVLSALAACGGSAAKSAPPAAQVPAPTQQVVASQPAAQDVIASNVLALPRPMTSFGAAAHEGVLYAYGGYFGTPHDYSREGQSGELLRIDVDALQITSLENGEGVQGAQLVSTAEGLVRVGGMRAENAAGAAEQLVSLADVARHDGQHSGWQALPPLPEPRSSHAAVAHDGKVYVLGGWVLSGARSDARFVEHTLVLDLESGKWSAVEQPFRVRAAGAGVVAGKIVLVGGLDPSGSPQRSVHVLDPKSLTWSKGNDFPTDAFGIAVTGQGQKLYASAKDGILRELSEPQGSFRDVAALAFPRFFHQLVMLDAQRVAVLGGISGMDREGRIAHVEVIDVTSREPRVLTWTLRNPSAAKNRQGVNVTGDKLVLFGGNRSLAQHDFGPEDFRRDAVALRLTNMSFQALPEFPVARQTVQTLPLGGALFALGGFGHDGEKARAHAEAYAFDESTGAWLAHPSVLPTPRTQFGLAKNGDDLWVFGGLDYDPSRGDAASFVHPTTVLKAAPGKPFAESGVNLPRPRRAFGGTSFQGRYVLVGGMAEGFAQVSECDVFDFASSSWSTMPCPGPRISPQLTAIGDTLYLAGGSTPSGGQDLAPNPTLEAYDARSGTWKTLLAQIPLEPRHLTMLTYRNALLLYSAHREDGSVQVALIVPSLP